MKFTVGNIQCRTGWSGCRDHCRVLCHRSTRRSFERPPRLELSDRRLDSACFQKSFPSKANSRPSLRSGGRGSKRGSAFLAMCSQPVWPAGHSDVPAVDEIAPAAERSLDIAAAPGIPVWADRFIVAAAEPASRSYIKKGQFLAAPWDVKNIIEKFRSAGNTNLLLTERGTSFGYNNLVVDFRAFPIMRSFGVPVVFDVTHSSSCREDRDLLGRAARICRTSSESRCCRRNRRHLHGGPPDPDRALCDRTEHDSARSGTFSAHGSCCPAHLLKGAHRLMPNTPEGLSKLPVACSGSSRKQLLRLAPRLTMPFLRPSKSSPVPQAGWSSRHGEVRIVGKKIAATLASTGPRLLVHPAEASHGDLGMITNRDVVIALSNSGETEEIVKLIPFLKRFSVRLIAMPAP